MKKTFFILGIVSILAFSCSSEGDNVQNQETNNSDFTMKSLNTTDLETAKSLYVDMIATQEYTDLKSSIRDFNSKLLGNEVSFETKGEWMTWIQNNIASTSFASVNEFETTLDESVHKMEVLMAENSILYGYMRNANVEELEQILLPGFDNIDNAPRGTACEEACYDACESQIDNLANQCAIAIAVSQLDEGGYLLMTWATQQYYDYQFNNVIIPGLNQCLYDCTK